MLKIRLSVKKAEQIKGYSICFIIARVVYIYIFVSPSIPLRMTIGAVRNQPVSLRFVLKNSLSKTITSCRDSCSPNHLPRNSGCIITICKNQNIWYRKLITVSIFHCGVSDGIIAIFLQLRLRNNASI